MVRFKVAPLMFQEEPESEDDMNIRHAMSDPPERSSELNRQRLVAAGLVPRTAPRTQQEDEGIGSVVKDALWDMALFGAATGVAGVVASGGWIPLVAGGLYGAMKYGQEKSTGEPSGTFTEMIAGSEFSPEVRAGIQAVEGAMFAGGAGKLLKYAAKTSGAKAVGSMTGNLLHGVEAVTSKPLTKLGESWQPIADKIYNYAVWPLEKVKVPWTSARDPMTNQIIPGSARSVKEYFGSSLSHLEESEDVITAKSAGTIRHAQVQKRAALSPVEGLEKELSDPSLSLMERKGVIDRLTTKYEPWPLTTRAKEIVKKFEQGASDAGVTPPYQLEWDKAIIKNLPKSLNQPLPSMMRLLDPTTKKFLTTGFTKETKDDLMQVMWAPTVNDEARVFVKDLMDLPYTAPRAIATSAREGSVAYMMQKLVNSKGLITSYRRTPSYELVRTGKFAGRWMPRDLRLELEDLEKIERLTNSFGGKWMSLWKSGKTILRPAYHIRNIFSNTVLADIGGLPFYRMDVYAKAFQEMKANSLRWQKFIKTTGGLGTFTHEELMHLGSALDSSNMLSAGWKLAKKAMKKPMEFQNAEENMFKFAKYIHSTEEYGMSHARAILDAQKHLINYSEASLGAAHLRAGIYAPMPFGTWYTKVIPLFVESAIHHPLRVGKWALFAGALQAYAIEETGLSDAEWDHIKTNMPEWMKHGIKILTPWRDEKQRLNLFNATFLMPGYGDLYELYNLVNFTSSGGLQIPNPAISFLGALASQEKSSGAPLYFDWEPPATKFAKVTSYAADQMLPSVITSDLEKVWDAITDKEGAPTASQAALSLVGLKMSPLDPIDMARKKHSLDQIHKREWYSQLRKKLRETKNAKDKQDVINDYLDMRKGKF